MKIKKFSAENFRNIEKCEIEFSGGVNLLCGNNAEGKTNAVEGIYLFARGKSFRASDERELIRDGTQGFHIGIEYEDGDVAGTLEYSNFGREKRRRKNGYKITKIKEMIGSFKAVLFSPDDLTLIKGGPEERRKFLNVAISSCYPAYLDIYTNFKRALENRNSILKEASRGGYYDEGELVAWSEYMAEYASYIYMFRCDYLKKSERYAKRIMNEISSSRENLTLLYESCIEGEFDKREDVKREYTRILTSNISRECAAGISLWGPHRDDIEIKINGLSSRTHASQGQQRSIVLALKLSEGEIIKEISGEYPVFLFDDVLSELDEGRRKYILEGRGDKQIIISSCEYDENLWVPDRIIKVSGGKYEIR